MENKPNLYIFLIDVSGSMQKHFEQVNDFVNKFNLCEKQEHIQIVLFHSEVTVNEICLIADFHLALQENHFGGEENIDFIANYSKSIVAKAQEQYEVKDVVLITDSDSDKSNSNVSFSQKYESLEIYKISVNLEQTFNSYSWQYMRWIIDIVLFVSIILVVININFCSNNNTSINISLETKEKELDTKTQPIINNITQNTNITIVKILNQFKIDIRPTINFNFNIDTKINNQFNFHINIPYRDIDSVFNYRYRNKIENYELGKYNLQDSLITVFVKTLLENKELKRYYLSSKNAKLKIIGETDAYSIVSEIRYKKPKSLPYIDINEIVFVNGKEQEITIKKWQQIKENYELGFLRAYFVGEFLKQKVDYFNSKIPHIEYHSKTNRYMKGGEYRTAEIELIICDVKL